jgi:hypothetical protein
MSKDFCASGLRLGCLHTRNASLNVALVNLAYFTLPAASIQARTWVGGGGLAYFTLPAASIQARHRGARGREGGTQSRLRHPGRPDSVPPLLGSP